MIGKWSEISVTIMNESIILEIQFDKILSISVDVLEVIRVGLVIDGRKWFEDIMSKKLLYIIVNVSGGL